MKKFLVATGCLAFAISAFAQADNVAQAKKLAGKTDKIQEARTLIQQAINDPSTAGNAETYFIAGKIEWDAYNKEAALQQTNPDKVDPMAMAQELVNGYKYFDKVFDLDMMPNAKGEVKPKYSKELQKTIAAKHSDFWNAGSTFYNAQKYYPEAYEAFMIYGDLPDNPHLGKEAPQVADTIRAVCYFNAGISAYAANQLDDAAVAFRKARENNYTEPQACIYEIACWQNIEQNDSTRLGEAKDKIFAAAKAGYDAFGMSQPVFLNNMVNSMINSNKENQALSLVSDAISTYPDNAALYGLRGYIYDRMDNDDASEKDYRMAAEMPNVDYETLLNAVKKLYRIGQHKWDGIEFGDPETHNKKKQIKAEYFEVAKEWGEKARSLTNDTSDIDYLLDGIDYSLSL